tara:strand:- start:3566 stop:5155 length:1590 start_codon:yes stop_codon:yes gene_type:complete
MEDIRLKDNRVLSPPLDLKNNADKTLSEKFSQLQSGSILKGLVVGMTPKGDVILNTKYGRFSAPNLLNLKKDDTINIKLELGGKIITGSIITVNNKEIILEESVKLNLVRQPPSFLEKVVNKNLDSPVTISNSSNVPKSIIGEISYLNLSKITKESLLSNALNIKTLPTSTKIPISVNIVTSDKPAVTAFVVNGIISSAANLKGQQLIKTEFGIITTQNTKMPVGQKLSLEVTSIDNKPLNNNIVKNVADFVFNISKEWLGRTKNNILTSTTTSRDVTIISEKTGQLVTNRLPDTSLQATNSSNNNAFRIQEGGQKLAVAQTIIDTKSLSDNVANSSGMITKNMRKNNSPNMTIKGRMEGNKNAKNEEALVRENIKNSATSTKGTESQSMNNIIKSLAYNAKIKQLSTEFHNIKELLTSSINENEAAEKLQTVWIPFYNGKQIKEYEVKLDRTREHFLRFIFDVNLENNPMQIDGLIKFENDSKTPRTFDLTIRSKNIIPNMIQQKIVEIYNLNQNMTGVRGNFTIEDL